MKILRSATITYSDGSVISTSLSGGLTDKKIREYFKIGKPFNIGNVEDNMQTVVKCDITPLKGLIVSVYKSFNSNGSVSDCTNGGLSSTVHDITICGDDIPEIFEANESRPAFRVVRRNIGGEYLHVEPWERPEGAGWMFGGNICHTSDSRFLNRYALNIHDRQ